MIELADPKLAGDTVAVFGRRLAIAVIAVALFLLTACNGSSDPVAAATPVEQVTPSAEVAETPTDVPTQVPTVEPVELTDEQRVEVAIATFDAESQPAELIAYDHLETSLDGTFVNVDVCGWTGDTVFDDIHRSTYRTFVNDDGEPEALFVSTAPQAGDCQNSELIESALQFTRDFDDYARLIQADPATFDAVVAALTMAPVLVAQETETANARQAEGLALLNNYLDGQLPESSVVEVLTRSYQLEGFEVLELISCREVPSDFGLYRGDVLVDDFTDSGVKGPHGVARYLLTVIDGQWKSLGIRENLFSDCFGFEQGWLDGINESFPDAGTWERLNS